MIILIIFLSGYLLIIFESFFKLNKAAWAILTGVLCWLALFFYTADKTGISVVLMKSTGEIASFLFFLLGAMTIVGLIEAHDGFAFITGWIRAVSRRKLLWVISLITFLLSAVLDNLTSAIIMTMMSEKIVKERSDRLLFAGAVIIAANAGGVWSPIGDVTTSMLWISHRITSWNLIRNLFLPSLASLAVPLVFLTFMIRNNRRADNYEKTGVLMTASGKTVLFSGLLLLISVPVIKSLTGLPPFMVMLLSLGLMWALCEFIHIKKDDRDRLRFSVLSALRKLDMTIILFFLGILLAVSALQSAGILFALAGRLSLFIRDINRLPALIGLISSVVDNVPLVAISVGMYPLSVLPTDHPFWDLLAYCTGTGGSILIIGSAAGVSVMGLEKIRFFEYLKKIGWTALIGYFAGILVYFIQVHFCH